MRILEEGNSTDAFAKKQIIKTPTALIAICCSILSLANQASRLNSSRQNTIAMLNPCFGARLGVRFFLHHQIAKPGYSDLDAKRPSEWQDHQE